MPPAPSFLDRVRQFLPRGDALPENVWRKRHLWILSLVWVHVAALPLVALATGHSLLHGVADGFLVLVAAAAATWPQRSRAFRASAATIGLISSSAILTHLSGGLIEMHFHFFVMVAVITLYQRWGPFLLAIGYVVLHHGVMGAVDPSVVYNHPAAQAAPWKWALVHGGFILAASAVGLLTWKMNEEAQRTAERYYLRLYEGERALVHELEEAARVKEELIGVVSHEFRTPLTAVLGLAQTLVTRNGQISEELRQDALTRIVRQAERLSSLVGNLLHMNTPVDTGTNRHTDLAELVEAVAHRLADSPSPRTATIVTSAQPGLGLGVTREAADLLLTNLLGNAIKFADRGSVVRLNAHTLEGGFHGEPAVEIEISNVGRPIPEDQREKIFEPFFQIDSSSTRTVAGVGLGLHIARRIVTGAGGLIQVEAEGNHTTFRVILPGGVAAPLSANGQRPSSALRRTSQEATA